MSNFWFGLMFSFFGVIFRLTENWFETQKNQRELENKNIKNELIMLRSHINTDFLFDTLAVIRSYTHISGETTAATIEKLSDILRYLLYESNSDKVDLAKDSEYFIKYLELLNLRFKEKEFACFEIEGDFNNRKIPPFLLIPYLEHLFKVKNNCNKIPQVKIKLQILLNKLVFSISQNIIAPSQSDTNHDTCFQQIKRRLDLLYPQKYSFTFLQSDKESIVKIEIQDEIQ